MAPTAFETNSRNFGSSHPLRVQDVHLDASDRLVRESMQVTVARKMELATLVRTVQRDARCEDHGL